MNHLAISVVNKYVINKGSGYMKLNTAAIIMLGVPLLMYMGQSVWYLIGQGRYGMALAFVAYAVANIGFILDAHGI